MLKGCSEETGQRSGRVAMETQIIYYVMNHELTPHSIGDVLDEYQTNFERFKNTFICDEDVDDVELIKHITCCHVMVGLS